MTKEKMTRKERREMEIEKITIPLEAYENMKEGIESSNFNLDHPEFIFEDIQGDIRDGNYFDASMRLMELHHQQPAPFIIIFISIITQTCQYLTCSSQPIKMEHTYSYDMSFRHICEA